MAGIQAFAAQQARGKLEPFSYDPGPLGDEQVEIDVQYCGICHSDLSMVNNEWHFTQYPFVPGHEAVGTVAALGRTPSRFAWGRRWGSAGIPAVACTAASASREITTCAMLWNRPS